MESVTTGSSTCRRCCGFNTLKVLEPCGPIPDAGKSCSSTAKQIDIIGDSVYWLYANLCSPTSQIARVSGRDRTDARRVCAWAAGLCCGLCRPLSPRQDLGRQGAPTPERRRRQRGLITDGRQTALHPRLPDDQSAT